MYLTLLALLAIVVPAKAVDPPSRRLAHYGADRFRLPTGFSRLIPCDDPRYVAAIGQWGPSESQQRGWLALFDAATGKLLQQISCGEINQMDDAAISDGVCTVLGRINFEKIAVTRIGIAQGKIQSTFQFDCGSNWMEYQIARDGRAIAWIDGGSVSHCDLATGRIRSHRICFAPPSIDVKENLLALKISPDSRYLAVLMCRTERPNTVKFQHYLLAADTLDSCSHIDLDDMTNLEFVPGGKKLIAIRQRKLCCYDLQTGHLQHWTALGKNHSELECPGNDLVAVASYDREPGTTFFKLTDSGFAKIALLRSTSKNFQCCLQGRGIAVESAEGVQLYDGKSLKRQPQSAELSEPIDSLRYLSENRLWYYSAGWAACDAADFSLGKRSIPVLERSLRNHGTGTPSIFQSPSHDGRLIATQNKAGIRIASAATNATIARIKAERSGPFDAKPCWWKTNSELCYQKQDDFSHLMIFNVDDRRQSAIALDHLTGIDIDLSSLATIASPDGSLLATMFEMSGETGKHHIWLHSTSTGKRVASLVCHGRITSYAISGNNRRLAILYSSFDTGGLRLLSYDIALSRVLSDLETSLEEDAYHQPDDSFPICTIELALSYDGRTAAYFQSDHVALYETASGAVRGTVLVNERRTSQAKAMAFTPDGRSLAVATDQGGIDVWDLDGPFRPATSRRAGELWNDLGSADGRASYGTVRGLAAMPEAAMALFREKVQPIQRLEEVQLSRWLADLDSPRYETREAATLALSRERDRAGAAMQAALAASASEEVRNRLTNLLAKNVEPLEIRTTRALEVTESLALSGNAEAKKLLQHWAAGADGPALTSEAKAALARVK